LKDGNTSPADDVRIGEAPGTNMQGAQWIERGEEQKPDRNPPRLMARSGDGATARRKNVVLCDSAFTSSHDVSACQIFPQNAVLRLRGDFSPVTLPEQLRRSRTRTAMPRKPLMT
jgi:hypothetical protein